MITVFSFLGILFHILCVPAKTKAMSKCTKNVTNGLSKNSNF